MTYCGEHTFVKYCADTRQATTLRCRSWTCPQCVDGRRSQLIAQAHRGKANTFLTLTKRSQIDADKNMEALALANAWRITHKRALREANRDPKKHPHPFGAAPPQGWPQETNVEIANKIRLIDKKLEYLCVIEAHASGHPHLHILCRSTWIDHEWLSAQMNELLGSPVVFVQRIQERSKLNAYVAKYCGKCTHKFGTAKRYWQSKGYQQVKYVKPVKAFYDWDATSKTKFSIHHFAAIWAMDSWDVTYEKAWHIRAEPPS